MGHVQSKRKREKRRPGAKMCSNLTDIVKSVTTGGGGGRESTNIHKVAGHRIYRDRDSVSYLPLDELSSSSGYFSSESSPGVEVDWSPDGMRSDAAPGRALRTYDLEQENVATTMSPWEELCTYKGIPLDDHPALTTLQNKQNSRLESMEQRMNKIRTNAQQAFERKKFAHLFRAKSSTTARMEADENENPDTGKLLQEARDLLLRNDAAAAVDGTKKVKCSDYSGEIIPVKIVSDSQEQAEEEHYLPLGSFGSLHFSEPVMILILPFLLPLFIIVAVIRGMSETFGWKQSLGRLKGRRSS